MTFFMFTDLIAVIGSVFYLFQVLKNLRKKLLAVLSLDPLAAEEL